jgi:hypothetical protein
MKLLRALKIDHTPGDTDTKASCLFCGHTAMEISNETPHQWQCWHCKEKGNAYTLVQKFYEDLPNLKKSDAQWLQELKPGTGLKAYRTSGVKPWKSSYVWPNKNQDGNITALYTLLSYQESGEKKYRWNSTPKPCSNTVIGLENLKHEGEVIITEGHWDYNVALTHFNTKASILGLCGSGYPSKLLGLLENRPVYFLTDNDEAGNNGVHTLAVKMKSGGVLPQFLAHISWDTITLPSGPPPNKCDIRDLAQEYC